jgi:hypothetical protein
MLEEILFVRIIVFSKFLVQQLTVRLQKKPDDCWRFLIATVLKWSVLQFEFMGLQVYKYVFN